MRRRSAQAAGPREWGDGGGTRSDEESARHVSRVLIGLGAVFFGVQHFLHSANVPGVPLEKVMPEWIPGGAIVVCLTGAIELVCGAGHPDREEDANDGDVSRRVDRLLVVVIYGPILIDSTRDPSIAVRVEGINYFTDTLLFAGVILGAGRRHAAIGVTQSAQRPRRNPKMSRPTRASLQRTSREAGLRTGGARPGSRRCS